MKDAVINFEQGHDWALYNGDCIEIMQSMPENSVHLSVFSPPYYQLYVYSNSDRDLGNSSNDEQFMDHFKFVIEGLLRITKPGRIVAVDCMNLPAMKSRDGYLGLKDFRGDLIRTFQDGGFIFHSEHCIWKDPLIEATRTKAIGLMHKQLCKDSSLSRAGIPQYLLAFRKPGENQEPIKHINGLDSFVGENPPTTGNLSHERWRRYASPVWNDIRMTRTLNSLGSRDNDDERHICPMALDIIERALELWSTDNEVIFDPFTGIGSTGHCALKMGRRFVGSELKESYFNLARRNLDDATRQQSHLSLELETA